MVGPNLLTLSAVFNDVKVEIMALYDISEAIPARKAGHWAARVQELLLRWHIKRQLFLPVSWTAYPYGPGSRGSVGFFMGIKNLQTMIT
jgi:hypothetical protein